MQTFFILLVVLVAAGFILVLYGRRKEKSKIAERANEDLREDAQDAALPPRRGSDLIAAWDRWLSKKNK